MRRMFLLSAILVFNFNFLLAQAHYNVLYNFGTNGGPSDGNGPLQGMVFDKAGNLYGMTANGGSNCQGTNDIGCGTVFKLTPAQNGAWTETILWSFCPGGNQPYCEDGEYPDSGLIIDSLGNLYGVTGNGGTYGLGVVFELLHPSVPGGEWTESTLWNVPEIPMGPLVMDSSGNLYGATNGGGPGCGCGTVFELSPSVNGWTEQTLYAFTDDNGDGAYPAAGLTFDSSGNLYGTTQVGGIKGSQGCPNRGCGTVFELSPQGLSGWQETVLHQFTGSEDGPSSAVNIDQVGNLYGTLWGNGKSSGAVFKLSPSNGITLFRFNGQDGAEPTAGLLMRQGAAYDLTGAGGDTGFGVIFRINEKGETVLYNFCSEPNCLDGSYPSGGGSLVSAGGRLYGTASAGGAYRQGVVFEVTR